MAGHLRKPNYMIHKGPELKIPVFEEQFSRTIIDSVRSVGKQR